MTPLTIMIVLLYNSLKNVYKLCGNNHNYSISMGNHSC